MKKLILISLLSLPTSFYLLAGDTYTVRTETFVLEVTKVEDIVPYKIHSASDKSLKLTAKTSEVIDYLYPVQIDSEIDSDQMYRIVVESNKDIDDIRKEVLYHFLNAVGLKVEYMQYEQINYSLSYASGVNERKSKLLASDNASVRLSIFFNRRVVLRGYSLESSVEKLNEAIDCDIFEAAESDLAALPRIIFLKRKLRNDPVEYLKSKGFGVEAVNRVVETPVLVYAE
jgi:hypothetical protein